MKSILVVGVLCLAAGVFLGRLFPAPPAPSQPAALSEVAPARVIAPPILPVSAPSGRVVQNPMAAAVYRERMDALRWIAASGVPMRMRTFSDSGINPMLARLLELTESESARLEKAYAQAQSEIDASRAAQAKSSYSADGTQLLVEAPGLDPAASGQIYDRFANEFKSTLGPDRTAMFEQISGGEGFEKALDGFGLNPVRYELTLRPVVNSGGVEIYEYKRHYMNAMGASLASSSGMWSRANIRKRDPLLDSFLPPPPPGP